MITVYGANTTVEQLRDIPVERPIRAGSRWKGVKHSHVIRSILRTAEKKGWGVKDVQISLQHSNADMVAAVDLDVPDVVMPEGQSLSLGIVASNAMKTPVRLLVGASIAVCHNGMATGELLLNKKHTLNFDVFKEIPRALERYEDAVRSMPATIDALRAQRLTREQADGLLMEAGRRDLLPWTQIAKVDHEYRHPTFVEHGRDTCWALLNAFTYIVKGRAVTGQMDRQRNFKNLLPQFSNN